MEFLLDKNLKHYIKAYINEIDIFAHYLGIPHADIIACINDSNKRINNPLRVDKHPSLGFTYIGAAYNNKLYAKDFANPFYQGDAIAFAGIVLGLDSNQARDFVNICKDIIKTFRDGKSKAIAVTTEQNYVPKRVEQTKIDIEPRKWLDVDFKFWNKYGIRLETLIEEKIEPVEYFWINDELQDYTFDGVNVCYAYYLGYSGKYNLYELYRPHADKRAKFRTNNREQLKEIYRIKPTDICIITKSKKDKVLIVQILKDLNITNTCVVYTSESMKLSKHFRTLLEYNFKQVFVNFDLDKAGVNGMKFYNKSYGYKMFPFMAPKAPKDFNHPKDITDFSKTYGYDSTVRIFEYLYDKFISNG